jgi:acyl dehydratase
MVSFPSIEDLLSHEGAALGTTGWRPVDQDDVDRFADLSGDHQWIHVDPRRARDDGPYGGTIVHGMLTLSLCTAFLAEIVRLPETARVINVGFERVRFRAPVRVGSRLRGAATLRGSERTPDGARVTVRIRAEIEGTPKPACVADQVLMLYG